MKTYIIDASVILTALIGKKDTAITALKQFVATTEEKRSEIYSTSFMLLEVANGARYNFRDTASAFLVYENLLTLPITYFSFNNDQIKSILDLSYQLNTTVYDTSYHYLAQLLSGIFVTCDNAYYQKAKHLGHIMMI